MGIIRTRRIRYGIAPAVKDTTSTPATLKFLDLKTNVLWDPDYNYQDRSDYLSCSNEPLKSLKLSKKTDGIGDITVEMTGLDTAVVSGVNSSASDFPLAEIFESAFAAKADSLGYTGAATPLSGSQLAVTAASTSTGNGVLVPALDGTMNFIVLGLQTGSNYLTDRAITDKLGNATTAAANAVIHGSRTFFVNNQVPDRKHLYFDADNTEWRREIFGALANIGFKFNSGGLADVTLKGLKFTDWQASAASGAACAAATAGLKIPIYGMRMMIDNTLYNAYDAEIELGLEFEASKSDGAANGVSFYTVTRCKPTLSVKLRTGTGTNPHEVVDATLETFRTDSTFDVSLLFGTEATAAVGFRFPAMDFSDAKRIDEGGLEAIQLKGKATSIAVSNTSITGAPMIMSIF